MSADPRRVKDLFVAALDLPDDPARRALLDRECGDDAELRRRLDGLLAAHDRPDAALGQPFAVPPADPDDATRTANSEASPATADYPPGGEAGVVIAGRYALLERIGEGGMGEVWVAKQTEPVQRKVAVKLIKAGMDSKAVVARFEAERQALALMDHPNIARVLDGGLTEKGRPFFVMELVNGLSLTRFCDEAKLTPKERLELFVPVCQAVQHAHQKGIVHRDLKPSNVLVTLYDGRPVPKVIDFGVAKATGGRLTDQTFSTQFGSVVGTLEYMAPEQAGFSAVDVDTRADVYSLGVILYELLTGLRPFDGDRLRKAAFDEVLRIIREEEPPKPSTKLSTAASLPSLAAVRRTEPKRLAALMRGELDWVVMRCLEKDRGRRYETASALSRDVQRYLADEPVEARPPSGGYRLRKFVRRNRGPVLAAAVVLLTLLGGIAGTTWGLVESDAARRAAEAAEKSERIERGRADAERHKADAARREAERSAATLQLDLDLAEIRDDSQSGVLRLARTLKRLPADARELREFAVVAVLAVGQEYAPLVPPITHDGWEDVGYDQLTPDALTLLTLGDDGAARLWDTRTARPVAVLRQGNERVISCALSPDGRTAVTDSWDGVVRFWDVPGGAFRAQTESRPDRYDSSSGWIAIQNKPAPKTVPVSTNRVLTANHAGREGKKAGSESLVELWDTTTGRRVARLDRPGLAIWLEFFAEGRWVLGITNESTIVIFSADDGRELTRVIHPNLGPDSYISEIWSPTGRRIITYVRSHNSNVKYFNVWEGGKWRQIQRSGFNYRSTIVKKTGERASYSYNFEPQGVQELSDDRLVINDGGEWLVFQGQGTEPVLRFAANKDAMLSGDTLHGWDGTLIDVRAGKRLIPPPGRRFHPDLARFAADGRFVGVNFGDMWCLIDTVTDKKLLTMSDGTVSNLTHWMFDVSGMPFAHLPGVGQCWVIQRGGIPGVQILLTPTTLSPLSPDRLELWAQVAVRGELGPDGTFVKWDKETWERKRQELAAKPTPYPDFPFPGHVAADKLHWLRQEFEAANDPAEKLRLVEELLRRSAESPDPHEAVRWRIERMKLVPEPAPPPRAAR
ncbi:MAG TPA: serine/threonine-protein kinase [Fimbriiglobus sp.]|nr:serine/threonine-protein kinase [Fimbriiglobus sp.]